MITINYLKFHIEVIPALAELWFHSLGKYFIPHASIEQFQETLSSQLNTHSLPVSLVALDGEKPIGMCRLEYTVGIKPNLRPWLSALVVEPQYRSQGLGEKLVQAALHTAKNLGYQRTYLCSFDKTFPQWCIKLGWTYLTKDKLYDQTVSIMKMDLEKAEKQSLL